MLKLTIDTISYTAKPTQYTGAITNRIAKNICTIGEKAFCKKLEQGYSWCPAIFTNGKRNKANWLEQMLFSVDIDGGNHSLDKLIARCELYCIEPFIIHESFSSKPEARKWRVIFKTEEPITNLLKAEAIQRALADIFADSDGRVTDGSRLFFATNKTVSHFDKDAVLDINELDIVIKQPKPKYINSSSHSSLDELPQHIAADLYHELKHEGLLGRFIESDLPRYTRLANFVYALMNLSYMTPELAYDIIDTVVLQNEELQEQFVDDYDKDYQVIVHELTNWCDKNYA